MKPYESFSLIAMALAAFTLAAAPAVSFSAPNAGHQFNGKGNGKDKGVSKGNGKAKNWFLQTLVLVEDGENMITDDRSGVIGRLEGAVTGRDLHDVPVFERVNGSPGAIVLTHGDAWGEDAGQYLTDYRDAGANKQVWNLAVTSNRIGAKVTLYWDGVHQITPRAGGGYDWSLDNGNPVIKSLNLVDLSTGEVIPAATKKGRPNSYSFIMDGSGERLFRWVQGSVSNDDLAISGATSLTRWGPIAPVLTLHRANRAGQRPGGGFAPPPALDDTINRRQPESRLD